MGHSIGLSSWFRANAAWLVALSALATLGTLGWACGGLTVGAIRERGGELRVASLQDVKLELVTRFNASDCPSPAWSADSTRLVFSEQWAGRVVVFELEKNSSVGVYDAATAPSTVADARYNIFEPAFLDEDRLVMGPGWAGALTDTSPWSKGLLLSGSNAAPPAIFPSGAKPQVCQALGQVLLEGSDGLRLVDASGNELRTYPNLCYARWSPDCSAFAALKYPQYCGESMDLVVLREDRSETLERNVVELAWNDDGLGLAFVRPLSGATYYTYGYDWGSLSYLDFESKTPQRIADRARNPAFVPKRKLLVYETPEGLGLSDLEQSRVMRELQLSMPRPSPNGEFLVGVSSSYSNYYYYSTTAISIYAFTSK